MAIILPGMNIGYGDIRRLSAAQIAYLDDCDERDNETRIEEESRYVENYLQYVIDTNGGAKFILELIDAWIYGTDINDLLLEMAEENRMKVRRWLESQSY